MSVRGHCARIGAATVFAGLTVVGPQACVAYADEATNSPSATASDGPVTAASAGTAAKPARKARDLRSGGIRAAATRSQARVARAGAAAKPARPAPSAAVNRTRAAAADPIVEEPAVAAAAVAPVLPASSPIPVASTRTAPSIAATVAQSSPAAAASVHSIGNGLNQLLTNTANWLAGLPGGPINDLLEGAVYLVRRTLFPTSVGVVTTPIVVPVHPTPVAGAQKLGIYIALGSDATPALFELDTGGPGIYGAYAPNNPLNSDWWGNGAVTTSTAVKVVYDSGNSYSGYLATSQVSFYSQPGAAPLLSTHRVDVGQMDTITNGKDVLWTPDGLPIGGKPPIDGVFYGDFGLAQSYAKNGITNVLAQLTYARGVKPGYRIHIDSATNTAWLQIGLTDADLQDPAASYFPEVIDSQAPPKARNPYSGLRYYDKQVFQANIKISDSSGVVLNSIDTGMTADTGSPTILHNTDMAPLPLPNAYKSITEKGYLTEGLDFTVTGTTTGGTQGQVYSFTTGSPSKFPANGTVGVQNNTPGNDVYYLNTGIYLFYLNDVVYSLGDRKGGGVIGMAPQGA